MLDATTASEDHSFWTNTGVDPIGHRELAPGRAPRRQPRWLDDHPAAVRQRLLDPELVKDKKRTPERKVKEIIQSLRVTQAFPARRARSGSSPRT
jgi:membrane peptidoglycan carboxypeptidase